MQASGVVEHIVHWLKDYATSSGVKGFVVGISGGIDSAVTSALAARTGLPVLCLEMPIHQSEDQVNRGRRHIALLQDAFSNVSSKEVELSQVFDAFVAGLPVPTQGNREMALVNSRSRLRMMTLYYYAGLNGYLVVGTGNKVEDFGVGFYTKYGDGGVDLSPIADLMKSEVYAIGREMGIIQEILDAAPTDGLWGDDRSDEDQIGASYPELEWAMEFEAGGSDPAAISERQAEVLAIYRRMNRANLHKMLPIPVCSIPLHLRS